MTTPHDIPSSQDSGQPLLRVDWLRTSTTLGVDVRLACGCGAQMTVTLEQLERLADDSTGLGTLGYNLLMAAAMANDDDHTLASRVAVRMALLVALKTEYEAWMAHVVAWLSSRDNAALRV